MIPDEDTLAEGIENLEAALKKKKQPDRPVLATLQALSSRDLIEQAKALGIDGANTMPRAKLVFELMRAVAGKTGSPKSVASWTSCRTATASAHHRVLVLAFSG